jgi:TRAP-type C4-dicarboxylate transport system substrate-binding protein
MLVALPLCAQQYTIKFATLAPEGSTWINVMKEYDQAVRKESGGRIGFRIYSGGMMGDEKDVVRKMRLGQLHSAGVTGVGIGEIAKQVRILDAPFLFKNSKEIDFVLNEYGEELRKEFENNGFVLLGWAEVGSVYIFSNSQISKVEDLNRVKMWQWEGDPVAEATFKAVNISTTQIAFPEVLQSLQTGLINAVYTSPLAAVSLQWFTAVKFMMDYPLTNAAGAVVISKREFDKYPPDLQEILLTNGKKYMRTLTELSRNDNQKSIGVLKKNKITMVKPDPVELKTYDDIGKRARRLMVGKLFSEDLLNRVEKSIAEFRAKGAQ